MQTPHTHSSPRLWKHVAIFLWKTIWYILVLSCLLVLHEDLWWYWGWKKRIISEVFETQIYSRTFSIRSSEIRDNWKKRPRVKVQGDSFFMAPQKWNVKSRQCISFRNLFSSYIFLIFRSLMTIVQTQSCFLCWLVWTM